VPSVDPSALPPPSAPRRVAASPRSSPSPKVSPSPTAALQAAPSFEVTLNQPRPAAAPPSLYQFRPADLAFLCRPLDTPAADILFHQEDEQDAAWILSAAQGTASAAFPGSRASFACVFHDRFLRTLPTSRRADFFRLLSALRRATFKQGPQGTSLVLGPDHIPFTRTVGKDSGMQQQASPRRGDKNYGEQAAPAKVSRQSRWGNKVVADSESARGSKELPDDGESSRGGRAQGYEAERARENRRARDRSPGHGRRQNDQHDRSSRRSR
ncbi:unnamed protein product, partial [Ectocarpus sp. 12 AP-2014]